MRNKTFQVYVAIGSSAGGFEALSEMLMYLPIKTGFIYFLAQHHALNEKNILATLLTKNSKIEVALVQLGMMFKADVFYILPPELRVMIKNNKPTAMKADLNLQLPLPNIDLLLSELSTIKDSKIIAILLSGTGHDGTNGMRVVKEVNGITMAQTPEKAIYGNMPKNTIEANLVDYVLNVKEIALKLAKLSSAFTDSTYISEEMPFETIVKILYKEKQLDLFKYKEDTVNRRMQKRMDRLGLKTINEYAKYFKDNKQEIEFLNQEILIGVTKFFRGIEAFEALKVQLKQKLILKPEYSEFRIWSIACSSGEEAYSLAILVNEICQELDKEFYIKIFASDIDDKALKKARIGEYKASALKLVKNELLEKYFLKTDDGYKVIKTLREQIVFAHHNFLNNPPFINIDLISCRNILIYLKTDIQRDIFSLFYYSLHDSGLLFLGSSESTLRGIELFNTMNNKYKIYEKNCDSKQSSFQMKVVSVLRNDFLKEERHIMFKLPNAKEIDKHLQEELFKYFTNHSLIVDSHFNIIYKKGNIPYLHFSDGLLSLNLFDNLDKQLCYEARAVIKKVQLSNIREISKFIQIESFKNEKLVQIIAQPFVMQTYKPMILINFLEISTDTLILNPMYLSSINENSMLSALNSQISKAHSDIQNISDELDYSQQNMLTINEELQESNEKFQSTVEELETSNEELRSSNEELQISLSSNVELQDQLSLILESSMNGVIGLDMKARHTFVNNRAAQMLGYSVEYLIGKESHRLWHHTKSNGEYYPEDECPIIKVLTEGKSSIVEDVFWRKDGTSFPVDIFISPIIENNRITGVVLNFNDISEKKLLQKKIKNENEQMLAYMEISGLIMIIMDKEAKILNINNAGVKLIGLSRDEIIGLDLFDNFINSAIEPEIRKVFRAMIDNNSMHVSHHVNNFYDIKKNEHLISWNNTKYKDENGSIIGVIATGLDITKEVSLIDELQKVNLKYEQTFKAAQIGIAHLDINGHWLDMNEYLYTLLGYKKEELIKLTFLDITHEDDWGINLTYDKQLLEGEIHSYQLERRFIHKNGNIIWTLISVILVRDSLNAPLYFISIIQDISEIKILMLELESKKNELENIIRFVPNPVMIYTEDGIVIMINEAFSSLTGYELQDIPSIKIWNEKVLNSRNISENEIIKQLFENNMRIDERQIKVITKNAQELIWVCSLAPLENIHNGKRAIIYSATDITKIQEKEEMLLAQSRQAAMGDMIGMIAHQWRQPLSVISLFTSDLKITLELDEEITHSALYELIDVINEQTQLLSHIIDDFRTFMKPEKEKEEVLLCNVYKKLRNMIQKILENNQVSLNFVNDCNIKFYTFPNELLQVFINLLNNSKDAFIEHKIENAKIDIITTFNKEFLIIEVRDNAGGIKESVIKKLGEPYVSTKSKNGTGLGIYMSKMIIEKHFYGNMSWKSCNDGTCFLIKLPLKDTLQELTV